MEGLNLTKAHITKTDTPVMPPAQEVAEWEAAIQAEAAEAIQAPVAEAAAGVQVIPEAVWVELQVAQPAVQAAVKF
jgi:hypothetical protein